jgi:hypothetical protein
VKIFDYGNDNQDERYQAKQAVDDGGKLYAWALAEFLYATLLEQQSGELAPANGTPPAVVIAISADQPAQYDEDHYQRNREEIQAAIGLKTSRQQSPGQSREASSGWRG